MALIKYSGFILFLIFSGCTTVNHISKTDVGYTVVNNNAITEDPEVTAMIEPYKIQLDAVMNEVLAVLPNELSKKRPESTLGNWVSDVIVESLRDQGYDVDFAVVNYGGLRVPYLTAGPLTRGEIFELTPFDNTLMIVEVPGSKLDSFFLLTAQADGWPVSKDVKMVIKDKQLVSAAVGGMPLDPAKTYRMATIDYVANGGDNMKVLIPLSRKQTNLIFRDVLIDYVKKATADGRQIAPVIDGRVIQQ